MPGISHELKVGCKNVNASAAERQGALIDAMKVNGLSASVDDVVANDRQRRESSLPGRPHGAAAHGERVERTGQQRNDCKGSNERDH